MNASVISGTHDMTSRIISGSSTEGALADYLLIRNAERGRSLEVFPDTVPFEVAALKEPLSVARQFVNRATSRPKPFVPTCFQLIQSLSVRQRRVPSKPSLWKLSWPGSSWSSCSASSADLVARSENGRS